MINLHFYMRSLLVSLFVLGLLVPSYSFANKQSSYTYDVLPTNKQTDVNLTQIVALTLDGEFRGAGKLRLVNANNGREIAGRNVYKGRVIEFHPNQHLEENTKYEVLLVEPILGKATYVSCFYTISSVDSFLISSSIRNGAIDVPINKAIQLTLSQPFNRENTDVRLANPSEEVPLSVEANGSEITIEAKIPLSYNQDYSLSVIENATSQSEVVVADISFKTAKRAEHEEYSYHPAIEKLGSEKFSLFPSKALAANQVHRVTFGIPFPKNYLTSADDFVVLNHAFEEQELTILKTSAWLKHESEPSLRSIIVQLNVDFTADDSLSIEEKSFYVVWGRTRQLSELEPLAIDETWIPVDSQLYTEKVTIREPNAYALFSTSWYGKSVLKSRMLGIGAYESYSSIDTAMSALGNTALNIVDPRVLEDNLLDTEHTYSMWLFDRAMTLYQLAFKTGKLIHLKEAHRATQFYSKHINDKGYFSLKPVDDMKYSYGESLVTNFLLVGDPSHVDTIEKMVNAWDGYRVDYNVNTNFWTERHAAYKLLGYVTAYELTGKEEYKTKALDTFSKLKEMQSNPLVETDIKGALLHTAASHSEGGQRYIASPWMSAILVDALERMDLHISDKDIPKFVIDMANFFNQPESSLYYWTGWAGKQKIFAPRYLAAVTEEDASPDRQGYTDVEHALDVSKMFALAYFYSCQEGSCNNTFKESVHKLVKTAETYVFPYWQREAAVHSGLSVFRLAPARKFNWWFKSAANIDFLMSGRRADVDDSSLLTVKQTVTSDHDHFHADDQITVDYIVRNIGNKKVKNVVVSAAVPGLSSNKVSVGDISHDGQLNGENIIWFLDEIEPSEQESVLSYTVKVNEYAVLQSVNRKLSPLLFKASVQYCLFDDPENSCQPWINVWTKGTQSQEVTSNWQLLDPVPPNTPPELEILSPLDNSVLLGTTEVTTFVEDEQSIRKAQLYINEKLVEEAIEPPYNFSFNADTLNDQTHRIKVVAYDHYGSKAEQEISFLSKNPDTVGPEVTITKPLDGANYCSDIQFDYSVSDDNEISYCEALIGSTLLEISECKGFILDKNISFADAIYNVQFEELEDQLITESINVDTVIGPYGKAVMFNSDAYLTMSNKLSDYDEMTFSFWLNPTEDEGVVIQQAWNYISAEYGWAISLGPNNHVNNHALALTWSSGDSKTNRNERNVVQSPANVIVLGEWQHIVIRKQGALIDMFVNSDLVHTGVLESGDVGFPITADKSIKLSKPMVHETMYHKGVVGGLDKLSIWQRALSEQEIVSTYYNQASFGSYTLTINAIDKAGNKGSSTVNFNLAQCH